MVLKGNELPGHEKTRRKLNCMALRERSQSQGIDCVIPAQVVYKSQSFEAGKRIRLPGIGVRWAVSGLSREGF